MKNKTTVAVVAVLLMLAGVSLTSAQTVKIGVFDLARVTEETAEGQRIQGRLAAFRTAKEDELAAKQTAINELRNQLQTQGLSLSGEKKSALEKDIQRKIVDLNAAQEAATREFQLEIAEAQGEFQEKLLAVVDEVGRAEGFTIILEIQAVAFYAPTVDVTTLIIDQFNRMAPAQEGSGSGS
jgi:Skp family chaperone for outer membrane proteins